MRNLHFLLEVSEYLLWRQLVTCADSDGGYGHQKGADPNSLGLYDEPVCFVLPASDDDNRVLELMVQENTVIVQSVLRLG